MKIAMVSEHASPLAALGDEDAGGQNVHVAALAAALAANGHEVTVYTRRDRPHLARRVELRPGAVVEHVPAGPASPIPKDQLLPYIPEFGSYLERCWQQRPPDVAHAHFWMSGLAALTGAEGAGEAADLHVPVLQTYHALGVVKHRHQRDRDTSPPERIEHEQVIGQRCTRVVATCSDEVFELARMGIARSRISVIPCGVNTEQFTPWGPAAHRDRQPRLLSVGRLVERKGVGTAIRALAQIPAAELLIAGGPGPEGFAGDPHVRRLRDTAYEYGVQDRVRFLGSVPHRDMPALFRSADAVVSVPWYEPFGIVPLEAMACGVPVVAAAVGGQIDTVVSGVTGEHVSPQDPDALAGALTRLLTDSSRLRAYGRAAAARVRGRYSWRRIATDTAALYEQAIAEQPQPRGRTFALGVVR